MLISFIPRILYWVLTDFGLSFGVLLSLITSLAILLFQIKRRDYYLIDIFSFIYFTVASVCTYVFNIDVFIVYSGVVGYFALSLMVAYSIAVKSPFTLRVFKKD